MLDYIVARISWRCSRWDCCTLLYRVLLLSEGTSDAVRWDRQMFLFFVCSDDVSNVGAKSVATT